MAHDLEEAIEERARLAGEAGSRVSALERLDQQRAALLRSLSHDLRTPLSTIRAAATDLHDRAAYDAQDDGSRAELLGVLCDEVERLDRVLSNPLSMSRIESGALVPDRQAVPSMNCWPTPSATWPGCSTRCGSRWTCPPTCRWSMPTTP